MRAKTDYGLETLVRMLYLEPVVRDRSVLVAGPRAEATEDVLRRMGAARVRSAGTGDVRPLPWDLAGLRGKRDADGGRTLPVRPGEVDLIFIPELGEIDDYRAVLGEAARVLGPEGQVMVSVRNAECTVPVSDTGLTDTPEFWSLDSLEELLAQYFEHVELVGQSPFLGYALASYESARGREGVRLDTSLMNEQGEDPEFIVAMCGHRRPARPVTNALFQMPMAEMALVEGTAPERRDGETRVEASLRAEVESLKRELGNRNVVASRLEAEIERLEGEAEAARQKMFDLRQKFEKERKENQKDALESVMRQEAHKTPETWLAERATLTRELDEATRALARAEEKLEERAARKDGAQSRIKDVQARMERAETKARELRVALKKAEARLREEETRIPQMGRRIAELERALDEAERGGAKVREERDRLAQELSELRARPPAPPPAGDEIRFHPVEDAAAGDAGGGNGRETAELRRELERREELIRDLIRELEVLPTIMAEEAEPGGAGVHELVGELERVRGEREELSTRIASLAAQLEQERARAEAADRQTVEAAALVQMVGDALEEGGPVAGPPAEPQASSRTLRDIQEALRRIASDPRAATVARELGLLWADIEERRKGL